MKNNDIQTPVEVQELISHLKKEDNKYKKMMKNGEILGWSIAVLMAIGHIIILLLPGNSSSIVQDLYMGVSYVFAFIIYALYFRYLKKNYNKIDYSVPALEMLNKIANNRNFFKSRLVIIFVPLLIIAVNISIRTVQRTNIQLFQSEIHNILFVMACFILLLCIVGFISNVIYNKKHKLFHNRALHLIEDIEKDNLE